jgi:hypothetical protein
MINSKIYFIGITLTFLGPFTYGQQDQSKLQITFGTSASLQDKRPPRSGIEDHGLDYDFALSIQSTIAKNKSFFIYAGVGYSKYISTFTRPFNQGFINGALTSEGRHIKNYTIDRIITPFSADFRLNEKKAHYFNLMLLPSVNFRKAIIDLTEEKKFNKWRVEMNGLELNPGIGTKIRNRLCLQLKSTIFNGRLDTHNPLKVWFSLRFSLD